MMRETILLFIAFFCAVCGGANPDTKGTSEPTSEGSETVDSPSII
jgi:hypothetical protein